jgi:acyl dehydratase
MPLVVLEDPRSLKEFVGREISVTAWLSLTQKRIEQFAEVTEDRQWIHLDRKSASRESPYGMTIAHGFQFSRFVALRLLPDEWPKTRKLQPISARSQNRLGTPSSQHLNHPRDR